MPTTPNYTLSLADAQGRIETWQNDQDTIKNALPPGATPSQPNPLLNSPVLAINAFTFKLSDLCQLFERIYQYNNPGLTVTLHLADFSPAVTEPVNAVRFYLGEDGSLTPTACLIGMGVSGFNPPGFGGKDILGLPVINSQPATETGIYDFSYPCPTTCPTPGEGIMNGQ